MSEFLVVTGMSGAGRSTAGASLEDLGWFVIDNLPAPLITKVAELLGRPGPAGERIALVVGRGGESFEDVPPALEVLRSEGHRVRVIFLDAPDDVLLRRFEGTRRRHPQSGRGVEEAIVDERKKLAVLRAVADVVLDTGEFNSNQLRSRILEMFGDADGRDGMQTSMMSFGYKYGIPLDVDLIFDCRFLPNPYWIDELRPQSGLDEPVADYVLSQPETVEFLNKLDELLTMLVPAYMREGKSYLTIGMGCTGGRHRSVVLAETLSKRLNVHGVASSLFHRDIDR